MPDDRPTITAEQVKEILHRSIMSGGLVLGPEKDQAFNYARIHRWIDSIVEETDEARRSHA